MMSLVDEARFLREALHLRGETDEADTVAALADALEAAERAVEVNAALAVDKHVRLDTALVERDEAQRWAAWFAAESDEWQGRAGTLAGWLYAARGERDELLAWREEVVKTLRRAVVDDLDTWRKFYTATHVTDLRDGIMSLVDERDEARAKEAEATSMMLGESHDYECARIDLAEARAAIARVEALADRLEADGEGGPIQVVTQAIATGVRDALRGEQG